MADDPPSVPRPAPTPLQALIVLVAIVPLVWVYVAVEGALGLADVMFIGFLLIFYWASILQLAPDGLLPALIGSLVGIGLAGLLHALPATMGTGGIVIVALLIAAAIYLLIRNQWAFVVNNATMLMLTVASAGLLSKPQDYVRAGYSVLVAGAYVSGLFLLPRLAARLGGMRTTPSATATSVLGEDR